MRRSLLLFCGAWAGLSVTARDPVGQTTVPEPQLAPGPYHVGFRSLVLYDFSRSFQGSAFRSEEARPDVSPRPVQVAVWYPGQRSDTAPLRVIDYRRLERLDRALDDWTEEEERLFRDSLVAMFVTRDRTAAEVREGLLAEMMARPGLVMAAEQFPLLVYGPAMLNGVSGNTVLFEYLASHGFVVAAHPSFGPAFDLMDTGSSGLETQVRDMEYVLGFMKREYGSRISGIGALGHSWGGMAAVVLAMRHPEVNAVLSLDSSVEEWAALVYALPDFDVTKLRSPFFHVQSSVGILATERNGPDAFYEAVVYAPTYRLSLPTLAHYDVVRGRYANPPDSSAAAKWRLYGTTNQFVRGFFQAHLLGEGASLDSLLERYGPRRSPRDEVTVEWHPERAPPPPSEAELVRLYLSGAGKRAEEAVRNARVAEPRAYREATLVRVGELLLWNWGSFVEAVAALELAAEFYPASPRVHELLGVAFSAQGENERAVLSFERSLELDSGNPRVRGYLEDLR